MHLQRLAAGAEKRFRFLTRPQLALVRQVLLGELAHLLFDRLDVFGHERPLDDEVVEEALVGGRADAALSAGKQIGDGGRQQVGRAVAHEGQRVGRVLVGHDPDPRVRVQRVRQIDQLAVDRRRQCRLGQTRRDPFRDVAYGRARGDTAAGSIWKDDCDLAHSENLKLETGNWKVVEVVGTFAVGLPTVARDSREASEGW